MTWFASYLSRRLRVPVEDLTGLKERYDLDVSWVTDPTLERPIERGGASLNPADAASQPTGASDLFTAIGESLGLRLEPRKQQIEVVVIDHIERFPTAN